MINNLLTSRPIHYISHLRAIIYIFLPRKYDISDILSVLLLSVTHISQHIEALILWPEGCGGVVVVVGCCGELGRPSTVQGDQAEHWRETVFSTGGREK